MRFLMLLLIAAAMAEHHLSRPHVPHYKSTKAAFAELARSLDTLSYVLTAKGVKPFALCGLSVPELGGQQASLFSNYRPRPVAEVVRPAVEVDAPATTRAEPRRTSAPKIAIVRYPNKKALDAALQVADAEIVADGYKVQAEIAQVAVDQLKVVADNAAGDAAAAQADADKLASDRAKAAQLELQARQERDAAEALKTAKVGATEFIPAPTAAPTAAPVRETAAPTTRAPTTTRAPVTDAPTQAPPRTGTTSAGRALVDGQGRTLYKFADEADGTVRCLGECASFWPFVPAGSISGEGIGSVRASNGNHATYRGRPLYRFVSDNGVGSANGHNENGFTIAQL